MALNNTSSLISIQKSLPIFIIKHTKNSLIKSNVRIFWPKFNFCCSFSCIQLISYVILNGSAVNSLIHLVHSECVLLVLTMMGRFLKREVYVKLFAKELLGTRIAHCNQLHDKTLLLVEVVKMLLMYFPQNINQKF